MSPQFASTPKTSSHFAHFSADGFIFGVFVSARNAARPKRVGRRDVTTPPSDSQPAGHGHTRRAATAIASMDSGSGASTSDEYTSVDEDRSNLARNITAYGYEPSASSGE